MTTILKPLIFQGLVVVVLLAAGIYPSLFTQTKIAYHFENETVLSLN